MWSAVLSYTSEHVTNPGFIHSLAANAPEPSDACRKVNFGHSDFDEPVGSEQDSDEDEVSLGTKSSFTSVPLKSVCVKVCSAVTLQVTCLWPHVLRTIIVVTARFLVSYTCEF